MAVAIKPEFVDLVLLSQVPGVGPILLSRLLASFDTATAVLSSSEAELVSVEGVGPSIARRIRHARDHVSLQQIIEGCEQYNIDIVVTGCEQYPSWLAELPDAPPVLFIRGQIIPADQFSVAIVGTRHASVYGRQQAERLAYGLARAGVTVISGLARGVDAAAHQGALDGQGRTIAVFGCGLGHIYPPEHASLAEQIVSHGALISEYAPYVEPRGGLFPQRNRIISGLSHATLVIEAPERSGSLITARTAAEQGREVLALPGNVNSRNSQGTNLLIRDGARLIRNVDDILECLGPLPNSVPQSGGREIRQPAEALLNERELAILDCVATEPTAIDQVIAQSGLPIQQVLATISVLEIRKLIRRLSGQYVSRV